MNRRLGVGNGALRLAAGLLALVNSGFDVAEVVQCVENTDDINAVLHALANESANGVVRIMLVTQDVLATQQHL